MDLIYKIKTASEEDIRRHLRACNNNFIPPLNETVVIADYSQKLHDKSITFETWDASLLVGCIACYFNYESAFITNVSTLSNYNGSGIASKLMENCIDYSNHNKVKEIKLEVNRHNEVAIRLYNKFGFAIFEQHDDSLTMKLEL